MGHPRICEDERRYRHIEPGIRKAVGAYAIGQRGTETLSTLAHAKVLADVLGWFVPMPTMWDRSSWNDVLNKLVKTQIGTHRCLSCQQGFTLIRPLKTGACPYCKAEGVEELSVTAGVL